MTQALKVADDFAFPLDLVVQQTGILARTGAGKTNTAVVIAEEVLAAGQQCVILDPPGAWHGLRSSADGEKPGFPIIVLGGNHGDLPLESTAGQTIADFIVDEGASVILDLSEFSGREMSTFVTAFAERLYRRKGTDRTPMLLIIEEADEVAPQRPMPDQTRMLGAIERIVKRGRMRGIGTLVITQRSASLNKNVLSQIGVLIAMQTTAPQDIKAIDDWVERTGDQARRKELLAEIAELPIGTAFVWSPAWLRVFRKVHFRRRRTFDSSATPKPGQKRTAPKRLAEIDLGVLRERMASTIEKAKAEDPRELRRRIAELERDLKHRPTETRVETVTERVEVPVVTEDERAALTLLSVQLGGAVSELHTIVEDAVSMVEALTNRLVDVTPNVERTPGGTAYIRSEPKGKILPGPGTVRRTPAPKPARIDQDGDEPQLRKGERRMLETLARHYPMKMTRAQLGTLSRFTPSGGTYSAYFSTLKRNGLISETNGDVEITEEGLAYVGADVPATPQTTQEIQEMWRSALRAGERSMLDELIRIYPEAISREELGERAGYTASGGTFGAYLSTLRRNGLIAERGQMVQASDTLFLGPK